MFKTPRMHHGRTQVCRAIAQLRIMIMMMMIIIIIIIIIIILVTTIINRNKCINK